MQKAAAISQKGVDAILTVGPLRGRSIAIATAALASRTRAPVLIPVDAAEGIAARGPEYQKADIPAGFFRGSPPHPKEDVATISMAVRLEARQNLSEEIVTGLTKRFFAMRRSLQSEVPIAAAMEKPDTEKGSAKPFTRVRQPTTITTKKALWINMATGFTSAPWPLVVWVL